MWSKVFGGLLVIAFLHGFTASATQYAYQVSFTDKNNTPYSLSTPSAYLSARAIARRANRGIAIDSADIPVNQQYIDSILTLTGGKLHAASRWQNMCVILINDSTLIHTLDGKSFISNKKLVGFYSGFLHKAGNTATVTTDATTEQRTTSLDATYYGTTWAQTSIVNGQYLHNKGYDGAGMLIAVLDAGFTGADTHTGFDSLHNSGRLIDVHNFTLASEDIYGYDTHGAKVLSTMAGFVPGTFVGTAPRAMYALYVTEDGNSEQPIELFNMLCATERADSLGADVITTSLGYNTFTDPANNFVFATDLNGKSTIVAKGANTATAKGIVFVATAGNEGGNSWNMILTPGDADSALTIGSVDGTGNPAGNSGYGPNAAGQIKPDVCTIGAPASIFTGSGYGAENGTSFSTPQIAGWAACLWQANPTATPYQVRQAIIRCASSYSSPGVQIGYGIPNFQCTDQLLGIYDTLHHFNAASWVKANPNPFIDEMILTVSPDTDQYVTIRVMDMTGKILMDSRNYFYKGNNRPVTVATRNFPVGIYIVQAISATHQQLLKVEKMP